VRRSSTAWRSGAPLFAALLVVACGGCSTLQASVDYDPEAELQGLETYSWLLEVQPRTGDPKVNSDLLDRRVRRAVDVQLSAQGYQKREGGPVDFRVAYFAAVEHKRELSISTEYYDDGFGIYDHGLRNSGYTDARVFEYDEGSLIIDLLHPISRRIMWRGVIQAELGRESTPEDRSARIDAAARKILSKFPPE